MTATPGTSEPIAADVADRGPSRQDARPHDRGPQQRLLRISHEMRRSRPVFIVGEARSGSTLLLHTLLKHPAFAPRRENLQESSFVVQAPDAGDFATSPPRNLHRFMLEDDTAWGDFLVSVRPLGGWLRAARRLGPADDWRWRLGPAELVARSYAFHAARARGCQRLLEKTPDHVHHIERLYRCFPRARLLYVYRHPVDVYTSYVRRGQVDPKASWARIGPEEFCDRHRTRTELALAAADRHRASFRLIRYEQLTATPEHELAGICDFLDEPCDPAVLLQPDPDPDRVAPWEGSGHLYRGITTATKRWYDYCPREDAAIVEDRLSGLMGRLGYARYTD